MLKRCFAPLRFVFSALITPSIGLRHPVATGFTCFPGKCSLTYYSSRNLITVCYSNKMSSPSAYINSTLRSPIIQILSSNSQELKKFQWLDRKTFTRYKSLSDGEEFYFRYSLPLRPNKWFIITKLRDKRLSILFLSTCSYVSYHARYL